MTRSISLCRPITGSSSLFFASSVRSRPNARKRRRLYIFLSTRRFAVAFLLRFRRREIRIELLQNFIARPLDIDFQTLQNARRHAFTFAQKSEQNVFGPDIGMIQRFRFLARERENFFHARRVGNVADHFCFRPGTDLFLHFHPHRLEIESHLLQNVDRHALPQLDQPEQQVLGPDVIVIEAVCFFTGERQTPVGRAA